MIKLILISASLLVTGCANTGAYYAAIDRANEAQTQRERAHAASETARYTALMRIAETGDAAAKGAAVMALALSGRHGGASSQVALPAPPQNEALQWASILVPGITQIGLRFADISLGKAQARANRDVSISTNQTFRSLGGAIERAGTYGYGYAGDTITTTNTLSGRGVIGAGSYLGDYSGQGSGNSGTLRFDSPDDLYVPASE
jgi:hypothetical protein